MHLVCARARAGLLITVEMSEICRTSGGESEVCDIFESDGLINIYIYKNEKSETEAQVNNGLNKY